MSVIRDFTTTEKVLDSRVRQCARHRGEHHRNTPVWGVSWPCVVNSAALAVVLALLTAH